MRSDGNAALSEPRKTTPVDVRAVADEGRFDRALQLSDCTDKELYIVDADPVDFPPESGIRLTVLTANTAETLSLKGIVTYVWRDPIAAEHDLKPGYFVTLPEPVAGLAKRLGLDETQTEPGHHAEAPEPETYTVVGTPAPQITQTPPPHPTPFGYTPQQSAPRMAPQMPTQAAPQRSPHSGPIPIAYGQPAPPTPAPVTAGLAIRATTVPDGVRVELMLQLPGAMGQVVEAFVPLPTQHAPIQPQAIPQNRGAPQHIVHQPMAQPIHEDPDDGRLPGLETTSHNVEWLPTLTPGGEND